jgi:hypothetical protein
MRRQYYLIAQSASSTILQDVDTSARLELPTYVAAQYSSQIVPLFNMGCFEA